MLQHGLMSLLVSTCSVDVVLSRVPALDVWQETVLKHLGVAQRVRILIQTTGGHNHSPIARTPSSSILSTNERALQLLHHSRRSMASVVGHHVLALLSGFRLARELPSVLFVVAHVFIGGSLVLVRGLVVFLSLFVYLMGQFAFLVLR